MKKNTNEIARAEIMLLDKMLPPVGDEAMQFLADPYEYSICYGKEGKRAEQNHICWCTDCGAEFPFSAITDFRKNPEYKTDKWGIATTTYFKHLGTCPNCGKPMKMLDDFGTHYNPRKSRTYKDIFAVPATMGEWRITRYFSITSKCRPNKKPNSLIEDIGATWQRDGKTFHYIAMKGGMFYGRWWKSDTRHFANYIDDNIEGAFEYTEHYDMPVFSLDEELKKRGISLDELHGIKLSRLIKYMEEDAHFETLWKQGDWQIASFFKSALSRYWPQIRIARNNKYVLNDENLTEWRDMIDLMRTMPNKDIYSPKYICPANIHEEHQRIVDERARAQLEARRRRDMEKLLSERELNEKYKERIARYLDLDIHNEDLIIIPLPDIDAFAEEGAHLGHCVFTCGYYKKADSLILSARNRYGKTKRWETIEVSLKNFTILQCYGYGDKHTERHKEIIDLVMKNMWQIKQRRNGKKMKVAC